MAPVVVSADWLASNLGSVRVFDASSHLPTVKRDAGAEFLAAHIPGALLFDIDAIADKTHPMPHMVPTPGFFAESLQALGVNQNDHIVVYDDSDVKTAARAWWMMRLFGHARVSILDGGLAAWKAGGGDLESGPARERQAGDFTARPAAGAALVDMATLQAGIASGTGGQILDARSAGRFAGEAPEPRKGLRAGHIPGSRNLPFTALFNEDGTYRDAEAMRDLFTEAGIAPDAPVATSCGSGVTACVLALGLHLLGNETVSVYDGSWTEWGASEAPIMTGPAD